MVGVSAVSPRRRCGGGGGALVGKFHFFISDCSSFPLFFNMEKPIVFNSQYSAIPHVMENTIRITVSICWLALIEDVYVPSAEYTAKTIQSFLYHEPEVGFLTTAAIIHGITPSAKNGNTVESIKNSTLFTPPSGQHYTNCTECKQVKKMNLDI